MRQRIVQLAVLLVALTTVVAAAPPQKHRAIKRVAPRVVKSLPPTTAEAALAANARSSADGELTKLREEIAALRKSTTALTQFAQAAQAAQVAT